MSNPEEHAGENPLLNLIQKSNQVFNPINDNNSPENAQNMNQKSMEPNYEELVSGFSKLGLDESSKQKISSPKKPEQTNFFQNPMMNNNKNKKEMGAFNYFFGSHMQGSDLSKQLGYNDDNELNHVEKKKKKDRNNIYKNMNDFNNLISQEKMMIPKNNQNEIINNNKLMMQINNNNMKMNMDPRFRNMIQPNMMIGDNQNNLNQNQNLMMNNFQRGQNNNMNNPNKNRKKKNRVNKINNNNNVNIQNMNLIMNQQQLPYNYQYPQNQNMPYIPNQNQNQMNLNINPNYNRNINRYNNPQQQVMIPQGESYPPMNMIGMNMNTNSISLEQYIARANNTFPGKFYVIKSINESNILNSIRFKIWCSTIKGNQKLQKAFKEADKKYPIFLFFSVNGSGKFMGIALMNSDVENKVNFNYWSQNDKWKGFFFVDWICIKDVPNRMFRNIINDLNENKPVTSSRDTQEICTNAGVKMLKIFKDYPQESTIFDSQNDMKFMNQGDYGNNNLNMNINLGGNLNNMNYNNQNKGNRRNMKNMNMRMGNFNLGNLNNMNNMNNINMNNLNIGNNMNNINMNNLNNNRNNMNLINNLNNNIPNPNIPNLNIPNINIPNTNIHNTNIPNPNISNMNSMPNMLNMNINMNNNNINYNQMLKLRDMQQNNQGEKQVNQNMMQENNMENLMMKIGNFREEKSEQLDLNNILDNKKDEEEEEEEQGEDEK